MKICLKTILACCAATYALSVCPSVAAQRQLGKEQQEKYLERAGQKVEVVRATRSNKSYGEELRLPDGSVIKTVWPAALCVAEVANRPWPNEPCSPPCEPAIYSLARVLPSGKELWAKSYLVRVKQPYELCDSRTLGFTVTTRIFAIGGYLDSGLLYKVPFDGTFYTSDPNLTKEYLRISEDTGDPVGKIPSNMRVVDAYRLREMKQNLERQIESEIPKGTIDHNGRKSIPKFFRRLEDLIFWAPKPAGRPSAAKQ